MGHFIRKYLYAVILTGVVFSCKKEEPAPSSPGEPHVYSGTICITGMPPVIGSCLDTSGELLFFHLPIRDTTNFNSPVSVSARVLKMKSDFSTSVFSDFGQSPFNSFGYTAYPLATPSGYIPTSIPGSIAQTSDGRLFMARHDIDMDGLVSFSSTGVPAFYQSVQGIVSVTAKGKTIYAMTGPHYDASINMIQWPRIYKIDSSGFQSLYYEFPSSISFTGPGYYSGQSCFGFLMDMQMDVFGSMYITFGLDNIIYKLDSTKTLSVYNSTVFCPVSIDITGSGRIVVASAPQYSTGSVMIKPVQLYMDDGTGNMTLIYDDALTAGYNYLNNYTISAATNNKIFLTSPNVGSVTLIE